MGDADQVDEVVARTLDGFGRIDLLVNNAGYRIRSRLEDLPRHEWDAMVGTNLTGVFLLSQAVGRVMIRQRAGKIVNVTSVAGRSGSRGLAAYAATKAGVMVLLERLRLLVVEAEAHPQHRRLALVHLVEQVQDVLAGRRPRPSRCRASWSRPSMSISSSDQPVSVWSVCGAEL